MPCGKKDKKTKSEGRAFRPSCNERENKTEDIEASKKNLSKVPETNKSLKKKPFRIAS